MAEASTEWDAWLSSSLAGLHSGNLFRTLRPTVPGTSAVEVRRLGPPVQLPPNTARLPAPLPFLSGLPQNLCCVLC